MSESISPRHSVSVAAAIVDGGALLAVQRRDNDRWEPPGGVLELGESIEDGLRREVKEETGLEVQPVRLSGVYKNMSRGIVSLVFRCTVAGGTLANGDESRALAWLTPEQIRERMSEAYAIRLLDALHDGPVPVRAHDGHALLAPD